MNKTVFTYVERYVCILVGAEKPIMKSAYTCVTLLLSLQLYLPDYNQIASTGCD